MCIFGAQQSGFIDYPNRLLLSGVISSASAIAFTLAMEQSSDGVTFDVRFFAQRVRSLGAGGIAGDFISLLFG